MFWKYDQISGPYSIRLFNSSKTKIVFFSKKQIQIMPKLFLNGDRLEFVPVHRHLGLLISESHSWTNFIDSVVNSAFKKLKAF